MKKGPLQAKLSPRNLPLLVSEADQLKVIEGWHIEDHQKLILLCDELGIEDGPHRFYNLSLALARQYHSGFQESKPLGKWTDIAGAYLVVEIERLTSDGIPGHGELWASYQLIRRPEWQSFIGGNKDPGEALRRQYQAFKKNPVASVARDAFKLHAEQGRIHEWESDLRDVLRNPHPGSDMK